MLIIVTLCVELGTLVECRKGGGGGVKLGLGRGGLVPMLYIKVVGAVGWSL